MDDYGGWLGSLSGGAVGALVGNIDRLFAALKGWRAEKRDAAASVIEGAGTAVDVMQRVLEQVDARLKASEEECERRVQAAIAAIREEWAHERKNLHLTISELARLLPPDSRKRLDPKLQKIIDRIVPEAVG